MTFAFHSERNSWLPFVGPFGVIILTAGLATALLLLLSANLRALCVLRVEIPNAEPQRTRRPQRKKNTQVSPPTPTGARCRTIILDQRFILSSNTRSKLRRQRPIRPPSAPRCGFASSSPALSSYSSPPRSTRSARSMDAAETFSTHSQALFPLDCG